MPPTRPRLSPTVLRDLARNAHADNLTSPALAVVQQWSLLLIGVAWFALIVAAPLLFCVVIRFPDGRGYPVTARDMTSQERRNYQQRKK